MELQDPSLPKLPKDLARRCLDPIKAFSAHKVFGRPGENGVYIFNI